MLVAGEQPFPSFFAKNAGRCASATQYLRLATSRAANRSFELRLALALNDTHRGISTVNHPRQRRRQSLWFGVLVGLTAVALCSTTHAQSSSLGVDAYGQVEPGQGLLVLRGSSKALPWIDAEAMVWAGAGQDDEADALVILVRLKDPRGYAELKGGRFVLTTGAVRPVHLDGGYAIARAPSGTNFEAFGGAPVVPEFGDRDADWLVGGRVSQHLSKYGTLGTSFYHRRELGSRAFQELGGDFALTPTESLTFVSRVSWDLLRKGLAELQVSASGRADKVRTEVFVTRRSPMRLLPATSLFTVLGDTPSTQGGADIKWYAAPRLDVSFNAALRHAVGTYGWNGRVRGVLRLDDDGKGSLLGEVQRLDIAAARWTGMRIAATVPIHAKVIVAPELEIVVPDDKDRGKVWPWGRLALRYEPTKRWILSAAAEASASQFFDYEFRALARVSYRTELK